MNKKHAGLSKLEFPHFTSFYFINMLNFLFTGIIVEQTEKK